MSQTQKEVFLIALIFSIYLIGYVFVGKYPFYRVTMYSTTMSEVYYYEILDENHNPYDLHRVTAAFFKKKFAQEILDPKFDAYFALHGKMNKDEVQDLAELIFQKDAPSKLSITRYRGATSSDGRFELTPEESWEFKRD